MTKVVKVATRTRSSTLPTKDVGKELLQWYKEHGRDFPWRRAESCYERIVAELMLQRTQAVTVSKFYGSFLHRFPSWESLACATEQDLGDLLKPIGLWRRRARTLIHLSRTLVDLGCQFPSTRTELEKLPGISQYIASAVLLLCHGQKEPLLDVNMARILERVYEPREMADIRYDPLLQQYARSLVEVDDPVSVNWAVMDLAATVCLRGVPRCFECPIAGLCEFAKVSSSQSTLESKG